MLAARTAAYISCLVVVASGFNSYGDATPRTYTVSQGLDTQTGILYTSNPITLSARNLLTLDYGYELAGIPYFVVSNISAPTQIEVKYAEGSFTLPLPQSDGPWTFSNQDSNSFRIETFNISDVGRFQSFFIQGGQRWETVRLLTDTEITFESIGFNLSSQHIPPKELPGKADFSNELYSKIFQLGALSSEAACVDAGNALATWEITPDGAYIPGQTPAQSALGKYFANYTMAFSTKIVRGGTGWRVAAGFPDGPTFVLTSNYPAGKTFLNVNRTLLPPNSVAFNYRSGLINREPPYLPTVHFPVKQEILEDTWYRISTTISEQGYHISIDGRPAAFVPITQMQAEFDATDRLFSPGSPYSGSIGFGPFQDQEAYVKDVIVTANNGTVLYQNAMRSQDVLAEYGVASSDAFVCLDGAKRDRLVWIGDFYHTVREVGASTLRWDQIKGTFDYVLSWQKTEPPLVGFVPISAPMGSRPRYRNEIGLYAGLIDYQDLFLGGICHYFMSTGDVDWVRTQWQRIKKLAHARLAFIDPYSGLMAGSAEVPTGSYFLGPANGSAPTALSAYVYNLLVPLAHSVGDTAAVQLYNDTAMRLRGAINDHLWSPSLGTYSLGIGDPLNYSITAIALTILSETANASQAASSIRKLPPLRCGVGYQTDTGLSCANDTQLAPNPSGFLLEALFKAHQYNESRDLSLQIAQNLLDDFWSKMVTQSEYYSGASWEYLFPNGSPGIDAFTSLAHPWGGAPTYLLPEYVLGIKATTPGYKTWEFTPLVGALGLSRANGTTVTPFGEIQASWVVEDGYVIISASVPEKTTATLVLPSEEVAVYRQSRRRRVKLLSGMDNSIRLLL